jgi:serine-threonine kinase receptor-associated protein
LPWLNLIFYILKLYFNLFETDKQPQIRNGDTGDWIGTFHGHKGAVWSAKIDSLTKTLAVTASGDFTAKLWCVTSGKELYEFKHKHVVKTVDFSADSMKIASGCQDGLVRIFNTVRPEESPVEFSISKDFNDAITKCIWTSESSIVVGKRSGAVELWDTRNGSV